jgi:sodium/potassium/calcium exchanger 6
VSLLSVTGVMMQVSPALIGMTVLGIGNGTCDMVANYLMARAGYPSAAIAAIYAGPMFNLLIGLGVSGLVGNLTYKEVRRSRDFSFHFIFEVKLLVCL